MEAIAPRHGGVAKVFRLLDGSCSQPRAGDGEGTMAAVDDEYGLGVVTALGFDQAVTTTRMLLRAQGFRILSEMPAPPALAGPGGGRQHLFMGVWERLITTSNLGGPGLDVGDHLACNVAVFE